MYNLINFITYMAVWNQLRVSFHPLCRQDPLSILPSALSVSKFSCLVNRLFLALYELRITFPLILVGDSFCNFTFSLSVLCLIVDAEPCRSPKFSFCTALSSLAFCPVIFSHFHLPGPLALSPPLREPTRLHLCSHPCARTCGWAIIGLFSFVSCLLKITILCCLMSNVLKNVVSHILSSFLWCFMQEGMSRAVFHGFWISVIGYRHLWYC